MKNESFGTELGNQKIFVSGKINTLLYDLKEAINKEILAKTSLKGKTLENDFPIPCDSLEEAMKEVKEEIIEMLREVI